MVEIRPPKKNLCLLMRTMSKACWGTLNVIMFKLPDFCAMAPPSCGGSNVLSFVAQNVENSQIPSFVCDAAAAVHQFPRFFLLFLLKMLKIIFFLCDCNCHASICIFVLPVLVQNLKFLVSVRYCRLKVCCSVTDECAGLSNTG